jgi:hypothetical protein
VKTITIEVPDDFVSPYSDSLEESAHDLKLAAAILWYDRDLISQSRGAEIAGLSRAKFIAALGDVRVDAIQITEAELRQEVARGLEAHRECVTVDLPQ